MKRRFESLVFLILMALQIPVQGQPLADIKFEKMDHNFGKIKEEGGPVTYNFNFTNTGGVPLIIQDVNASCGCTTPEWSREPVLPGKTGFIKVSYNPDFRPGVFNKSISISANVPQNIRVLTISGDVIPKVLSLNEQYPVDFGAIRLTSAELPFAIVKDNERITDTLHYYNPGNSPVTVRFKIVPPHISITSIPAVIAPQTKGYFLVSFDGTKKPAYGNVANRIYLAFNNEEKYNHAITVSAVVEEDFSKLSPAELQTSPKIDFNARTFDFGEIPEGKRVDHSFRILNKGKKTLVMRSVTASCECTSAKPASLTIAPGNSTELKITFDSKGLAGMQNKIITLISNDPSNSRTTLRVTGSVRK